MGLYKFKDKGPAYGLGHTEGELVMIDDDKGIDTIALVPEVSKDSKGNVVNTGRMINAKKHYTVEYLVQQGVITMASAEEKKAFEKKADINSKADAFASKTAAEEAKERKAKASKLVEA